jgi:hypothetical protein
MRLIRHAEPFNHAEWIFELKLDGFRALAYVENNECRLVPATVTPSHPSVTSRAASFRS